MAVLLLATLAGLGMLTLAWPTYRDAADINLQAEVLRHKGENPQAQVAEITRLSSELDALNRRVQTGLKLVPESADVAGLIRVLSLPVDGVNVRDQTFTAGDPKDAVPGSDSKEKAQLLTVDLQSRFDAIFAIMRAAESLDRLLRISSVSIVCERDQDEERPMAKASMVLEAIYEPPRVEEP